MRAGEGRGLVRETGVGGKLTSLGLHGLLKELKGRAARECGKVEEMPSGMCVCVCVCVCLRACALSYVYVQSVRVYFGCRRAQSAPGKILLRLLIYIL